ncbi:MAG: Hsp20/alpha crystallin family protein [Thermodesulfobacteriota bacterium]|nr:Hsp20/alpha crystallin family protein [Thermodesulfobacteriota bacterium]
MAEKRKDIKVRKKEGLTTAMPERTRAKKTFTPRVDICGSNNDMVVFTDMPGVNEGSVNITLDSGILTIEGFVEPDNFEGYDLAYAEYDVGDYYRVFTLSDAIDQDRIEASIKDGVLKLVLPKAEPAKARRIIVKVQ